MRLLPLLLALSAAAQTRPLSTKDSFSFLSVSAPIASPASPALLYSVARTDLAANRTLRAWHQLGSNDPVPNLPPAASDLTWSPDGKSLAYLHDDALWLFDWATKTPRRLCPALTANSYLAHSGARLAWAPDSSAIAFSATLEPLPPTPDPLVITRIQYKTRTAFSDNRRTHLYLVPAAGGAPKLLTPGPHDEHSLAWAAGPEIVFLSNHEPDPDSRLNYDLFAVNPTTGALRQLTKTPGTELDPRLSPDGATVAFTATTRPITTIDSIAEDEHLYTLPLAGGAPKPVHETLDRRMSPALFLPKGLAYFAEDHGRSLLFLNQERLLDRNATSSSLVSFRGRLYFVLSDPTHPREIYSLGDGKLTQETHLNDKLLASFELSTPEHLELKSFDGTPLEAWLYPPLEAKSRYPLILTVHGGPHGAFGYSFNPQPHAAAARGYATLLVNPRGSTGYGQKFSDGTLNAWGAGDYKDLMAALDHTLKTHPQADPAQLFLYGGSYGGFMTNWIVTQTARFRAATAAASVSNLISFYANSLYQDLIHAEFSGYPWDANNFSTLWAYSPLKHIKNARTPMLFLHGELDNEVPITQAEEMFTALRQRGIEAILVRYPREGHGFREPAHQLDALDRRLAFFDKFRPKPRP